MKASDEQVASRQQADGFIINSVTYVKQDRLKAWFPKKSVREALRQAGVFNSTRSDTPTVEKQIPGIKGKPRYYAIKASALDRASE